MLTSRRRAAVLAVALLLAGGPARAQDHRAAARELVKTWQDAVVNIRVVIKLRVSMGGREVRSSDDTVEMIGTVIEPGGLTVVGLGSINPGGMMTKFMGARGGAEGVDRFLAALDGELSALLA